jgi:hypothetical protein
VRARQAALVGRRGAGRTMNSRHLTDAEALKTLLSSLSLLEHLQQEPSRPAAGLPRFKFVDAE